MTALGALAIATLLLLPMISAVFASPASQTMQAPRVRLKDTSYSSNWSGYAVESSLSSPSSNFIQSVSGSWIVPTLSCSTATAYSSIWVGIDGYSSSSVEQLGTEQDCSGGIQQNYAWFEMYPSASRLITTISVHPGDRISAHVLYTGSNQFRLSIRDVTSGQSFSTIATGVAQRSSAEWIVEAPSSGSILPLANFGTATITGATFATSNSPTVNQPINGLGSNTYTDIIMQDPAGGKIAYATPSLLSPAGNAFRDTFSN